MSDAAEYEVDARGLRCPEPVMMLHARLRRMQGGETVRVLADDPSTARDIPKLCEHLGHALLHSEEHAGQYVYLVRKRG